jgi:hypothetical protein
LKLIQLYIQILHTELIENDTIVYPDFTHSELIEDNIFALYWLSITQIQILDTGEGFQDSLPQSCLAWLRMADRGVLLMGVGIVRL